MHSRIFQVSSKPVDRDNYISESNYYDGWFVGSVADYVADVEEEDQKDSIDWLDKYAAGSLKIEGNKVTVINKEEFFRRDYDNFIKALDDLKNITLNQFTTGKGDLDLNVYRLNSAYEDRYGFYVDDCGEYGGLMTINEFMRTKKDGDVFYIGGVVDYHS